MSTEIQPPSESATRLWKLYVKRLYADRLPRGIAREAFVLAMRRAAERASMKIDRIGPEEEIDRDYSVIELRLPESVRLDVLYNANAGIVGFASPPPGTARRHWVWRNSEVLSEALLKHYDMFAVATSNDLATRLNDEWLNLLLPSDRTLLMAWNPATLGDVLFKTIDVPEPDRKQDKKPDKRPPKSRGGW